MQKPERRDTAVRFYVTRTEAAKITKAAGQDGMSISEFSRVVILESIHPTPHMDDIRKEPK